MFGNYETRLKVCGISKFGKSPLRCCVQGQWKNNAKKVVSYDLAAMAIA
jgi:hypothetical protein